MMARSVGAAAEVVGRARLQGVDADAVFRSHFLQPSRARQIVRQMPGDVHAAFEPEIATSPKCRFRQSVRQSRRSA